MTRFTILFFLTAHIAYAQTKITGKIFNKDKTLNVQQTGGSDSEMNLVKS